MLASPSVFCLYIACTHVFAASETSEISAGGVLMQRIHHNIPPQPPQAVVQKHAAASPRKWQASVAVGSGNAQRKHDKKPPQPHQTFVQKTRAASPRKRHAAIAIGRSNGQVREAGAPNMQRKRRKKPPQPPHPVVRKFAAGSPKKKQAAAPGARQRSNHMINRVGGDRRKQAAAPGARQRSNHMINRVGGDKGFLHLPHGIDTVKINIGPNLQPQIKCKPGSNEFCLLLDIQHDVVSALRKRFKASNNSNVVVLHLGISDYQGIAHFQIHGGSHTGSTSLSDPAFASDWNAVDQGDDYTPVMTLATILESIPPDVTIAELCTDMQGHDFAAIQSAGEGIKRVQKITAECWNEDSVSFSGVKNSLQNDWEPLMTEMGFSVYGCEQAWQEETDNGGKADELDCTFVQGLAQVQIRSQSATGPPQSYEGESRSPSPRPLTKDTSTLHPRRSSHAQEEQFDQR